MLRDQSRNFITLHHLRKRGNTKGIKKIVILCE
jgi:hypothetical protein